MVESQKIDGIIQVPTAGLSDNQQAPMANARTAVHNSDSDLGWMPFRTPTRGPELNLVNEYLATHLPPPPAGQMLTVFLEPQIESGFPDLVAVYWSERIACGWDARRARLTAADIRVAHFLATDGRGDLETLDHYFRSQVSATLDRLHAADMIRRHRSGWLTRSLRSIFAVRRLIAIEAKVTNPFEGLHQALQNTWFASESYLLLPKLPKKACFSEVAARFGVGVAERGLPLHRCGVRPRRQQIPLSYASWLFNEWAWRSACLRE